MIFTIFKSSMNFANHYYELCESSLVLLFKFSVT